MEERAKGEPWSCKGAGYDFNPSRMPAGRDADEAERRHRDSAPTYRRTGGGRRRKGGGVHQTQELPGAEPRLFITLHGLVTSVGYGLLLLSGARQRPTMSPFDCWVKSREESWTLAHGANWASPLGHFQPNGSFGPITAHQPLTADGMLTSAPS
jgi:hypothetical protein